MCVCHVNINIVADTRCLYNEEASAMSMTGLPAKHVSVKMIV